MSEYVDLLAELERIRERARRARRQMLTHDGVTGVTALQEIEHIAEDAIRHAPAAARAADGGDRQAAAPA